MANIKTVISMQPSLDEKVTATARKLKIPRSRVLVRAVEEFIQRQDNQLLLAQLNKAYENAPTAEEKKLLQSTRSWHRRIMESKW